MFLFNNRPGVGFLAIHFYWCGIIVILIRGTFAPSNKEFTIYFEKTGSKMRLASSCLFFRSVTINTLNVTLTLIIATFITDSPHHF